MNCSADSTTDIKTAEDNNIVVIRKVNILNSSSDKSIVTQKSTCTKGDMPFVCKFCGSKYKRSFQLDRHLITHTVKYLSCEKCDFKTHYISSLTTHYRTHTGEKPFTCEICNVKFSQKCHLKRHMFTHTGEKPFCCNICCYKTAYRSLLTRHYIRNHPKSEKKSSYIPITKQYNKLLSCYICNYETFYQSVLTKHYISEHPNINKTFSCNIKTNLQSALTKNCVDSHSNTNAKPFSCNFCDFLCTQSSELSEHILIHHKCRILNYE